MLNTDIQHIGTIYLGQFDPGIDIFYGLLLDHPGALSQ